eukprot:CAMPEP_0117014176 /NCGR_PEP_ID=MMETSP0472-20121206/11550_1 /TAXON_ID=693140 ORGANISM="Tiarina fusus, Strain LIS" /NCGR_SAMPLE_ID=MMETSP0472 /ASSEMBLY_ACC=CAM_ASM_000603 /LENGTH=684 /DNA_ID=CAMNT_0004717671 /DNA_START=752 /DNA_END=2806 /DNA_ORIENTATION=-
MSSINDNGIFIPVIPLLEASEIEKDKKEIVSGDLISVRPYAVVPGDEDVDVPNEEDVLLGSGDLNLFLNEQKRGLTAKLQDLGKIFPDDKELITIHEASIVMILKHSKNLFQRFSDAVDSVENMLRKQLIQAIGKEVQASDFAEYMTFHNRKLFKPDYVPSLFCYAIRRPDHSPEGIVSIDSDNGSGNESIYSIVKKLDGGEMRFPISAATKISFGGERYVHAWVSYQFSGALPAGLKVIARARQFSSFILMIGTVTAADEFQPKEAVIVQNKDDLLIPLLSEVIPTPKAFKKAVESLSQNQRNFAKAFRSMQLESTLFAICVVQIKPQLEKLLRLPDDSLTKEIRLTQDLMKLFIEYQIPSDLISFEPEEGVSYSSAERVATVKRHVAAVQEMIAAAKQKEIDDARQKAKFDNPIPTSSLLSSIRSGARLASVPSAPIQTSNTADFLCATLSRRCAVVSDDESDFDDDCDDDWGMECCEGPEIDSYEKEEEPEPESKEPEEPEETQKNENSDDQGKKEQKEPNLERASGSALLDFTKLPGILNKRFDELDTDAALHATILKTGEIWNKKFQKGLLSDQEEETLGEEKQQLEKSKAFDLLDALSRSGALTIDAASFHVVVAATHCFDETLINTIVKDNVNPIEKVERSSLIISSTIHEESPSELIKEEHLERVKNGPSSHLFVG